jgi:hypothetical protein
VVGLTLIAVPLVTARLPGVMTPVPFSKSAVRLELDPTSMDAGLAVKLVMTGGGGVDMPDEPPEQPAKPSRAKVRTRAAGAGFRSCLNASPICSRND